MPNHRYGPSKLARTRIDIRPQNTLLYQIDQMCSEEGVSRNEMICRLLWDAVKSHRSQGVIQNNNEPMSEEVIKCIFESHYMLSHQYGNLRGRRMDSLALEAAAEARKKLSMLSLNNEESV
jgi:metal-responsive CopG/Arc/MetJ family transcriptional regulator